MKSRDGILAHVTASPSVRATGRTIKGVWKRVFFWPLTAMRKQRLDVLGIPRGGPIAVSDLRLAACCPCKSTSNFVPLTREALRDVTHANGSQRPRRFGATAIVVDLDRFATFDDWRVQVSKRTSGKYHRSANKARRLGYSARIVGKDSYARSLYELTGSKLRRSKGLFVWAAIAGPWEGLVDTHVPPQPPTCPWHWRICWGAFRKTEDGEQLAAFAILIRAGDTVWIQRLIGHGAALTDGVTKLLIFDIMAWLLARETPETAAIRTLVHGHLEEGSAGLFDWKRYLGFEPRLIEVRP